MLGSLAKFEDVWCLLFPIRLRVSSAPAHPNIRRRRNVMSDLEGRCEICHIQIETEHPVPAFRNTRVITSQRRLIDSLHLFFTAAVVVSDARVAPWATL